MTDLDTMTPAQRFRQSRLQLGTAGQILVPPWSASRNVPIDELMAIFAGSRCGCSDERAIAWFYSIETRLQALGQPLPYPPGRFAVDRFELDEALHQRLGYEVYRFVDAHRCGDWGTASESIRVANELSLARGEGLVVSRNETLLADRPVYAVTLLATGKETQTLVVDSWEE